jgi:hypothetical protein
MKMARCKIFRSVEKRVEEQHELIWRHPASHTFVLCEVHIMMSAAG